MPDKKRPKIDSPASKDPKKAKSDKKDDSVKESFNYDPVHFIRSHSKNNDPADIQTQIWEVRAKQMYYLYVYVYFTCSGCI